MKRMLVVILPWLALGLTEVALAWAAVVRPASWQVGAELLGLLLLGGLQLRLAPAGPARSPALPGLLAVTVPALLLHRPGTLLPAFAFLVGGVVLAVVSLRILHERLGSSLAGGLVLALVGGVLGRWVVLAGSDVADPRAQLGRELVELPGRLLPDPAPVAQGPPLVLISLDTLRADHAVKMDSFQAVGATGVLHPQALATSSWTLPSMASAHTGLPAHLHGAGDWPGQGTTGPIDTAPHLAEELGAAGYRTAAFVTNPYCSRDVGFHRGFDLFAHVNEGAAHRLLLAGLPAGPHEWEGGPLVDRAVAWVEDQPDHGWFLWVHLLDAHLPYRHLPADRPGAHTRRSDLKKGLFDEATRQAFRDDYAHEVEVLDGLVARLLAVLPPGADVVLTSDHGEEWWDHGGVEHGHSHHGEVTDVAIALGGPDVPDQGWGSGGAVSLTDVAPTLRAMAGLEPRGHDLREPAPEDRIVLATGNKYEEVAWSARQGRRRLIWEEGELPVVYDLEADPGEHQPLEAEAGEAMVDAIDAAQAERVGGTEGISNEAGLRALGYLD